ncbi:MAG: GATA zinc finger-domain-containing protein [Benniella sp.]|nr:MAG: GATA zinc finger-domain-containing protein [Benniella sp.]
MDLADISAEPVCCPSSPLTISSSPERSPSPEAVSIAQQDTGATTQSTANDDNAGNANTLTTNKPSRQLVCFNCQVTQTPLWRRTPDRKHSLCNACGLYYKQYGAHRPLNVRHKLSSVLIDPRLAALPYARPSAQTTPKKTTPPLMTAKQGIACANCSQTQTPLWRKNDAGEPICNACGLYAKLHNRARPVTMRKTKITRRRRDWGGNLAHQAKAQAHALALFHAQFADIVEQMNAHQMNRFLSILETRCGVLRNRILACTEGSNPMSSFDNLF